ncbi:MAG: FAD-dependent oxidoreductase [Coriobacteriales bacterium]|jgi:hypothetical protein|nr:FAD-dependent oxidoreductase [Coriobacteriales bacterium]
MNDRSIARRDFLKGLALTGSAVAATGMLAACSPSTATNEPMANNTETTVLMPTGKKILTDIPEIAETDIVEAVNCDVVVCGAGVAGLAAARSAAEEGAKVIVLEKKSSIEVHGFEFGALNCGLAVSAGAYEDPVFFTQDYQQRSCQRANMDLIRLWVKESGRIFDWWIEPVHSDASVMDELTVMYWPRSELHDRAKDAEQTFVGTIDFKEDPENPIGGKAWVATGQANQKKAEAEGAEFRFLTVARKLVTDSSGKVTGVIAANDDGTFTKINTSKGVVLCTGGLTNFFGTGARELMEIYCPNLVENYRKESGEPNWEPMFTADSPVLGGNTGDGHLMAIWAGAQMEPFSESSMGSSTTLIGATVALEVNINGRRFHNEDQGIWPKHDAILTQPNHTAWQIFDVNWRERLHYQGIGHRNLDVNDEPFMGGYTGAQYIEAINNVLLSSVGVKGGVLFDHKFGEAEGIAYGADTLEELAEMIGVPTDALVKTVDRYNDLVAMKYDEDYGCDSQKLFPIISAPFFATKTQGMPRLTCMSGMLTDGVLQLVDKNLEPIAGLWCAGATAGQRFQPFYQTPMSGLNHGFAVVHGHLAGQYAAQS